MKRQIVWFSCGAASACVAKLAPAAAHLVYCDTLASEHPDNRRFLRDVEEWTGKKVEIIGSMKYLTIDDVFESTRYMAGISGARCTVEMKKVPRFKFQHVDDIHMFGLTYDEQKRVERFEANNPELTLRWVLREEQMTKEDCYAMIRDAGIELPAMYALGFKNNNCIGCVKATSAVYWDRVRRNFPEDFARRAAQSRAINVRLVRYKGKRMFLDELPGADTTPEEDIECGPICIEPTTLDR
jgi:hypothetical protein